MKSRLMAMTLMVCAGTALAQGLPKLNIDPNEVSLTGLSSGGYMAVQYHAVYGATVRGAAIIAAGPYHCAGDNPGFDEIIRCVSGKPDPALSVAKLKANAEAKLIDPLDRFTKSRVYLFWGQADGFVSKTVADALHAYYAAVLPADQIKYVDTMNAQHGFITDNPADERCDMVGDYFINNCKYDQAGEILQWIYKGELKPRSDKPAGKIVEFDQKALTGGVALSFDDKGYAYIPPDCAAGEACKLHIVFHGCGQGVEAMSDKVYTGTGHNRWADANRIVMLYPQVKKSGGYPYNPMGCWDWWGYNDNHWDTNKGQQLKVIKSMVDQLTSGRR
ncbi:MAG TPA: PHB depolymerase family esterase [Rhodocyclaceae bacterium]|nr:PHB depolymerase family esterase [Rhodocyclaceae bacterium]